MRGVRAKAVQLGSTGRAIHFHGAVGFGGGSKGRTNVNALIPGPERSMISHV